MNVISILIATVLLSLSAQALTKKEQKQLDSWNAEFAEAGGYGELMKKTCGFTAPLKMDPAFVTPFMEANTSAAAYCDSPRGVLWHMCEEAISKAEIVKKIKSVSCKLGKEKEATLKLNGTELEFTVGLGASNLDDKVKEWLENNL